MSGWRGEFPESVLRKMCRAQGDPTMSDLAALIRAKDALSQTWEDGQSNTRWKNRAVGVLRGLGVIGPE